ncbi:MAG: metal-dependent hydrolase [Kiritimatiellia bacterium]
MPSPVVHLTVGWYVYRWLFRRISSTTPTFSRNLSALAVLGFSLLPDADFAVGIAADNVDAYHNGMTHSVLFVLGAACLAAAVVWTMKKAQARQWFSLAFVCGLLHLGLDFFTVGRGLMLAWPFSQRRFQSPLKLFYGLHWSDGFLSWRHLLTLLNEMALITVVLMGRRLLIRQYSARGRNGEKAESKDVA